MHVLELKDDDQNVSVLIIWRVSKFDFILGGKNQLHRMDTTIIL